MLHGNEHGLSKFYVTRSQIAEADPQGGFNVRINDLNFYLKYCMVL